MPVSLEAPDFWDPIALDNELRRVFDICQGCRICFKLCPSFERFFAYIDEQDGEVGRLEPAQINNIIDLCYQCKLCYPICPYIPPHRWEVDYPRLMLRAKALHIKEHGWPYRQRIISNPELLGKWGSKTAPLSNWLNSIAWNRQVMHAVIGIHRERILPQYHRETFVKWFKKRKGLKVKGRGNRKVALFYTCFVNYHAPEIGRAAVEVLEHNGIEVSCPEQVCCGMPYLDSGAVGPALKNINFNLKSLTGAIAQGHDLIALGPTCCYMLKKEYPFLLPGEDSSTVSAHTYDICEYLMVKLQKEQQLNTSFPQSLGHIAYHFPCHLKVLNIGYKSRDLLQLVPATQIKTIERCSGMDGTWGMKKEYHRLSLEIAQPLIKEIKDSAFDLVVTDCSLSALQIQQLIGSKPIHPIQALHKAYGL